MDRPTAAHGNLDPPPSPALRAAAQNSTLKCKNTTKPGTDPFTRLHLRPPSTWHM
jgi:hypothetical protein